MTSSSLYTIRGTSPSSISISLAACWNRDGVSADRTSRLTANTGGTWKHRLAESSAQENRANYLHQLHDATLSLLGHAKTSDWNEKRTEHANELAACDSELSELALEKKDIEARLDRIDETKIQVLRDEIDARRETTRHMQE